MRSSVVTNQASPSERYAEPPPGGIKTASRMPREISRKYQEVRQRRDLHCLCVRIEIGAREFVSWSVHVDLSYLNS